MVFHSVFTIIALLPLLTYGSITVKLQNYHYDIILSADGFLKETITDGDIDMFSITDDILTAGVRALGGSAPTDVFLRNPTANFGNQFSINNWPQTQTILTVDRYRLFVDNPTETIENRAPIINNSTLPKTYTLNYNATVVETSYNIWSRNANNTNKRINYDFRLPNLDVEMIYANNWGTNAVFRRTKFLRGSTEIIVPANSIYNVSLVLVSNKAEVRLNYRAGLVGNMIGHFRRGHQGQRFWPYDVNPALRFGGISSRLLTSEVIYLRYYLDLYVSYTSADTGREVARCQLQVHEDDEQLILDPGAEDLDEIIIESECYEK